MTERRREMTLDEAREWVTSLPWRKVRSDAPGSQMDPHFYVINGWPEVPADFYWAFVRAVKREGYLGSYTARYRPDRPMVNSYLELGDGWVYWAIPPKQICRTRIEYRQHERLPEQGSLLD